MAFRKRNIPVGTPLSPPAHSDRASTSSLPGVRPSPLTSHPVTSTGTASLDELLGGHAGLALGTSLMVEESGNTEFSSVLLRNFAAEGICQGHVLHVVGVGEGWVRDLPAVAIEKSRSKIGSSANEEKMKIAWRYERLGQVGERGASSSTICSTDRRIHSIIGRPSHHIH
jgi:elongator complex protein 4